jgi:peptidoglycan LD-endopeptidase LytH
LNKRFVRIGLFTVCLMLPLTGISFADTEQSAHAPQSAQSEQQLPAWIQNVSKQTGLQWYDIAAIHQYEYNLHNKKNSPQQQTHLSIPAPLWAGLLNPNPNETNPALIRLYGGIGRDGNGDGMANRLNREDATLSFFSFLSGHGCDERHLHQTLLDYYQKPEIVKRIEEFKEIYKTVGINPLKSYVFPLPIRRDYSYRDTWGEGRSWGGRRIHEGTDIFAPYGTPVLAVTYGYVETKGWNQYGGWRVGIRTVDNLYIYYAHLSGYAKGLKEGMVVKPGDVIGYVGSSGYGRVGTSGKFPPHLHFGLYRSTGKQEWAFDPYPSLKSWEMQTAKRKRQAGNG